mmetsp:Transcript_159585/g.306385  ORF Transcript_159585/g.306385 Transcript_159585/m.306385 type:complete len:233 (+) Transcript_159585:1220-1918(+)
MPCQSAVPLPKPISSTRLSAKAFPSSFIAVRSITVVALSQKVTIDRRSCGLKVWMIVRTACLATSMSDKPLLSVPITASMLIDQEMSMMQQMSEGVRSVPSGIFTETSTGTSSSSLSSTLPGTIVSSAAPTSAPAASLVSDSLAALLTLNSPPALNAQFTNSETWTLESAFTSIDSNNASTAALVQVAPSSSLSNAPNSSLDSQPSLLMSCSLKSSTIFSSLSGRGRASMCS